MPGQQLGFSPLGPLCPVLGEEPRPWESRSGHRPTVENSRAGSTRGSSAPGPQPPRGPLLSSLTTPVEQASTNWEVYRGQGWAAPEEGGPHLSPGECVPGIVHDTVKIIGLPQGLHLLDLHLQKVILLPCEDQEKGVWEGEGGGRRGRSVRLAGYLFRVGDRVLPALER